jgi:hypothetical protein
MDTNPIATLETGALAQLQKKNPKVTVMQVFQRNVARARIFGLLSVLLLGAHAMAYGQQQVVDLSTGVTSTQSPISVPPLINDPKWEVKPPGGSFQPVPVTTGTTAGSGTPWASDPHARWISPYIDGAGNMDSPGSAQTGDFTYRRRFDLTSDCPVSNASVSLIKVGGDNEVTALTINGHSHPLASFGFGTLSSATVTVLPGEITSGGNTIELTVNNFGGYTGLFVYGNLTINFDCPTVGVNKDLQNDTGQIANDIEILLAGSYTNINHYDGYPANLFASFNASPAAGGNTLLTWSNPNNAVQPGQIAHVGFNVPGTSVNILSITWTRNGKRIGCPNQVSTNTHAWGSAGSQVVYTNNTSDCCPVSRYVGGLTVEWHRQHVALADLNPRTRRKPMRTDVIRKPPIRLTPGATASVNVPAAPPNARFGVIVLKVGSSATLSDPDVTTDFLEFPVQEGPRKVQAAGSHQSQ